LNTQDAYLIDKARVRLSFNRAAASYDAAAALQREVRARMLARLDLVKLAPQRILDAGAGTGSAALALAQRYSGSQVVALDLALNMLSQAGAKESWLSRMTGFGRMAKICGDLERLPLSDACMDMVWSNLALQWCNDLDAAFTGVNRVLRAEGLFMFSTFGPDTLKELRAASQADPDYVHVSRFIDMHDIGDALIRAGFSAPVMDVEHFTLTYDDVRAVMRDLKAIGAHNAAQGRRRGLEGKGFLQGLAERYEAFRQDGKLPATFEVIYGHAWKGQPLAEQADGAQVIRMHRRT
jgi:malonyl-CoA O-methyltransferase